MKKFYIDITGNEQRKNITVKVFNTNEDDYLNAKKRFSDYNTAREWAKGWADFLQEQRDVCEIEINDYISDDLGVIWYNENDDEQ